MKNLIFVLFLSIPFVMPTFASEDNGINIHKILKQSPEALHALDDYTFSAIFVSSLGLDTPLTSDPGATQNKHIWNSTQYENLVEDGVWERFIKFYFEFDVKLNLRYFLNNNKNANNAKFLFSKLRQENIENCLLSYFLVHSFDCITYIKKIDATLVTYPRSKLFSIHPSEAFDIPLDLLLLPQAALPLSDKTKQAIKNWQQYFAKDIFAKEISRRFGALSYQAQKNRIKTLGKFVNSFPNASMRDVMFFAFLETEAPCDAKCCVKENSFFDSVLQWMPLQNSDEAKTPTLGMRYFENLSIYDDEVFKLPDGEPEFEFELVKDNPRFKGQTAKTLNDYWLKLIDYARKNKKTPPDLIQYLTAE